VAIVDPFLRALSPGVPAYLLFVALRQTLQAMSLVRPVLVAVLIGNLVNAGGNWLLIYGHLGFREMGAVGSAWSTTASRWLMTGMLAWAASPALAEVWRPFSRSAIDA